MSQISLREGYRALVVGASGGLGSAFVAALADDPRCAIVHAASRHPRTAEAAKIVTCRIDLLDEASIEAAAAAIGSGGPLDLVIVATGILHDGEIKPEKTWRAMTPRAFERVFAINTAGPALIAKHFLGLLNREHRSVLAAVSARVGSIGDNELGGWHAYRASKAALNMLIRNFAIELRSRNKSAICVALHPGTVDTSLSAPFKAGVAEHKLFSPERSAGHLLAVIDCLEPGQSGKLIAWDGTELPY